MLEKTLSTVLLFSLPSLLLAHGSHGNGVVAGFTHPIFGLDHLFAILSIGILSYFSDTRKWYLYLLGFLVPMIVGGLLGIGNEATFTIEKIIALSVFVFGALISARVNLSIGIGVLLFGIFGFVHGYAHGAQMPPDNTALKYISGYAIGTILVGTLGMFIGIGLKKVNAKLILVSGLIFMALGIHFLLS
jgi:urease accessory protein